MKIRDTKSNKIFMLIVVILFGILLSGRSCSSREETNFNADINNNLYVESTSADIHFWVDDNLDSIKVVYNTDEDGHLEVKENNNTTSIVEKINNKFFKIDFENGDPTISIYLPSNYYNEIEVKSISGDVETYSDLKLPKLTISSAAGDISLMDAKIESTIKIDTISGQTTSQNITSKNIDFNLKSGDLESYYLEAEDIKITGISGDINIDTIDAYRFDIKSTSSEIDIYNMDVTRRASINNVSGDIDIATKDNSDNYQFNIKTISGDINYNEDNHEGNLTVGEGIPIDINTVSGEVDINTR